MTAQTTTRFQRTLQRLALLCAFGAVASPSHAAPAATALEATSAAPKGTAEELVQETVAELPEAAPTPRADAVAVVGLGTRALASQLLVRPPARALRELAAGAGSARLVWPIEAGSFVRGFGYVRAHKKELPHLGIDIAAKTGTPIHAVADGVVAYANDEVKGYGNLAIVVHADGAVTSYAHCNKLLVVPGQLVQAGEVIAEVGSTGISRGPHLHFEYRLQGKPRDPMNRFARPARKREALAAL